MQQSSVDPLLDGLEAYVVGGHVRDSLLGRPAGDRDWVVIGATPQEMIRRGFTPVGDDFPVFLHPRTHEEYALARTERKSGRGYHGFVFHAGPQVTLQEDLGRRDLTVNAMARKPDGDLVDPHGGAADLQRRVLRHVGPAFAEDPVRLLRLARFAARFHDFSIAPQTLDMCRELVDAGEVDALVPERVWQELAKGLMTDHPQRMFEVLRQCGALDRVAPGLLWQPASGVRLDCAVARGMALEQRYALLFLGSADALHEHLRVPGACRDLARLLPVVLDGMTREHSGDGPARWLGLLQACDALRRPERFFMVLDAAACVRDDVDTAAWQRRLAAVRGVDAGAVARAAGADPRRIQQALKRARIHALEAVA